MLVTAISDTHCQFPELPGGDLLLHAGDFTWKGRREEVMATIDYFKKQLAIYRHIVFIAGNHELTFERKDQRDMFIKEHLSDRLIYLQENEVIIDGFKIYGAPQQPEFCDWAFNVPRGDLFIHWDQIPDDTDILITHGPPHGYGDRVDRVYWRRSPDLSERSVVKHEYVGCHELLDAIRRVKPQAHIFGHIHEGYGVFDGRGDLEGIKMINASVVNRDYRMVNKPVTFQLDLPKGISSK